MKKANKILNHEIWHVCDCCGLWFDVSETTICPDCKTLSLEYHGI